MTDTEKKKKKNKNKTKERDKKRKGGGGGGGSRPLGPPRKYATGWNPSNKYTTQMSIHKWL